MNNAQRPEKFLSAKEIASAFEDFGKPICYEFALELVRATPGRLGMNARFSDVLAFWQANPDFSPFGRTGSVRIRRDATSSGGVGIVVR